MSLPPELADLYAGAPARDRWQMRYRWATCPMATIDDYLPDRGRVLDFGCGHGLLSTYLALRSADREVVGFDIDRDKISVAEAAAGRLPTGSSCRFTTDPAAISDLGPWNGVVLVDVLYLVPPGDRAALFHSLAANLAVGGTIVIKEIDHEPRWKYELALFQERLATRVFGITEGSALEFEPVSSIESLLQAEGLRTGGVRADSGYAYPHYLVLGRRESTSTLRS